MNTSSQYTDIMGLIFLKGCSFLWFWTRHLRVFVGSQYNFGNFYLILFRYLFIANASAYIMVQSKYIFMRNQQVNGFSRAVYGIYITINAGDLYNDSGKTNFTFCNVCWNMILFNHDGDRGFVLSVLERHSRWCCKWTKHREQSYGKAHWITILWRYRHFPKTLLYLEVFKTYRQ